MELLGISQVYTLNHPSGVSFSMRHWTIDMQEKVDRECVVQDGKGGFNYLVSKERELKLDLAIESWSGITINNQDAPCTLENKKKLPVGVILWIIKDIDERAGLRMPESEKKS